MFTFQRLLPENWITKDSSYRSQSFNVLKPKIRNQLNKQKIQSFSLKTTRYLKKEEKKKQNLNLQFKFDFKRYNIFLRNIMWTWFMYIYSEKEKVKYLIHLYNLYINVCLSVC